MFFTCRGSRGLATAPRARRTVAELAPSAFSPPPYPRLERRRRRRSESSGLWFRWPGKYLGLRYSVLGQAVQGLNTINSFPRTVRPSVQIQRERAVVQPFHVRAVGARRPYTAG